MKIRYIIYSTILLTLLTACGRDSYKDGNIGSTIAKYTEQEQYDNKEITEDNPIAKIEKDSILYEDAADGLSTEWITAAGPFEAQEINGVVKLTTNWISQEINQAEYQLPMYNDWCFTLELDIGGVGKEGGHVGGLHTDSAAGEMPHFSIGVYVNTKYGERVMIWDSYFNHEHYNAFIVDTDEQISLNYPSPIEHVRGFDYEDDLNKWEHFKVNINDYLQQLEPENELISVEKFLATGGYLDNIKLTNN